MKTRQQAAANYINEHRKNLNGDSVFTITRSDLYEHWNDAFLAGCEHADKEHRDFCLLVGELLKAMHFTTTEEFNLFKKTEIGIKKHLAAFTEREQTSLPFKD